MLPEQIIRLSRIILQSSIMAIFLFSCVLYTTATITWFAIRFQEPSVNYWYIFGLLTTIFWALLGVTPAELFLVFLPLSISIGICVQTVWDRFMVKSFGLSDLRHGSRSIWEKIYSRTTDPAPVFLQANLRVIS